MDVGAQAGGNLYILDCDIQGGLPASATDDGGNINANPLFSNPPTDLHLQPGSPCLGAGSATYAPATTLDGKTRPNPPSIGAYEVGAAAIALSSITASPTSVVGGSANATGTVTLTGKATATASVTLTSSNSAALSVPGTLNISAGYNSKTFTATSHTVGTATTVTITATYAGVSQTTQVTVTP